MITTQYDLFGEIEQAETQRLSGALICLRDAIPYALEVVVYLTYWRPRDNRSIGTTGDWAYSVRDSGICYEPAEEWWTGAQDRGEPYGWDRTPARHLGWDELADLIWDDPRRQSIAAWAASLTAPDRWRDLGRPHELWPDPDTWHPDYIDGDHERPGWPQRLAAWQDTIAILTDAAARLTSEQ